MAVDLQEAEAVNAYETSVQIAPEDFPYRALSRGAIASVILAPLAMIGLLPMFLVLLVLAVFGLATAVMGLRATRLYPREYSGRMLAKVGAVFNLLVLFGGIGWHSYVYATEVPDGYERMSFYVLQSPDNAPDVPPEEAVGYDGKQVFVKGYIHPSSGDGQLNRFVLVPDLGTCCFGGQPKSTDMMEVVLTGGQTVRGGLSKIKLAGEFTITPMARQRADFENPCFYRLRADYVK